MDSEAAIHRRIAELEEWLKRQGVDVKREQAHLDEGSRERLYWHYGYLVGLRDAVKALTKAEALHLH
jgi:hypothetical protein